MNKKIISALVATLFCATNAQAETIFEALASAYDTNPVLHSERAASGAVNEDAAAARSGFRPTVALQGGYTDNHRRPAGGPTTDGYSKNYGGAVVQPIFNGFSTYNAVKAADNAAKAELNMLYNVEQTVLLQAGTAYLDVVRDEAIVNLQKNNERLLKKQLDETLARYDVGEVTRTDVAQSRASYAQAQSDLVLAEGNLAISKANYLDVIGHEPQKVVFPENLSQHFPDDYDAAMKYAEDNKHSRR